MLVADYIITILVSVILTIIFCYLFFLRRALKDMKMERVRYYRETEVNFNEAIKEKVGEIEEKKEEESSNALVRKE